MFDKFKQMGALTALFQNKEKLREAGDRIREKAGAIRVEGEGGGGAVRVIVDGRMKVLRVELTPALISGITADDRTRELAGAVIADAVNAAQERAQGAMREVIEHEAGEMGLGDLGSEFGKLLG
jgi:nucleoid-associated protein EbfC